MTCCPFCSSDKVYRLLNTLRCKRCKNIWKEGGEEPAAGDSPVPATRRTIEPLEKRMEKRLDEYLARSGGKFCITTWQAGDISKELFMRYLQRCVKDRKLEENKDQYGRTWYRKPG